MRVLLMASAAVLAFQITGAMAAEPALGGHCVVCLYEGGTLVSGSPEYAAVFDRQTYQFPSQAELNMFRENPLRYAPALGGDCVVCFAEMGVREAGKPEFAHKYKGRLYLFPAQEQLDAFQANPDKYANVDLAYNGLCPVCLLDAKKRVRGKRDLVSVYDGRRYLAADADAKARFDAAPARYAPVLDGLCAVCLQDAGQRVHGSVDYGAYHKGRVFLLADEQARKKFLARPSAYADVDLAQGGNCIVCKVLAGKQIPGTREHFSVYKGRRFLFPSGKEREMFDAEPRRFVLAASQERAENHRPETHQETVQVVGRTACAGCAYGKRPLADPESLGIAVVTADKVYIVERGEELFPDLFASRFDGLRVKLTGTVKKSQGKFVWIDPDGLEQVR